MLILEEQDFDEEEDYGDEYLEIQSPQETEASYLAEPTKEPSVPAREVDSPAPEAEATGEPTSTTERAPGTEVEQTEETPTTEEPLTTDEPPTTEPPTETEGEESPEE